MMTGPSELKAQAQSFEIKADLPGSLPPATPIPPAMPDGVDGGEVARTFDEFFRTFESYRAVNDARLAEIENRGSADVISLEKLDRLDAALDATQRRLDDLTLKSRRPQIGAREPRQLTSAALEPKAAFEAYVRSGQEQILRPLETKALSAGSDPDGGYLVPEKTEAGIMRRLSQVSPIRAIAGNRQVSSSTYKNHLPFPGRNPAGLGKPMSGLRPPARNWLN